MKENKKSAAVDPVAEELKKLTAALAAYRNAEKQEKQLADFLEEKRAPIEAYVATGDLGDEKAVGAILVKKLQAELASTRIAKVKERRDAVESALEQEVVTVRRLLVGILYQIRNAQVEKAAREMEKHFPNLQAARRQAFQATEAVETDGRIHVLEHDHLNTEPEDLAPRYIELAPQLAKELAAIEKQVGGSIPSETELRAP